MDLIFVPQIIAQFTLCIADVMGFSTPQQILLRLHSMVKEKGITTSVPSLKTFENILGYARCQARVTPGVKGTFDAVLEFLRADT